MKKTYFLLIILALGFMGAGCFQTYYNHKKANVISKKHKVVYSKPNSVSGSSYPEIQEKDDKKDEDKWCLFKF